MKYLIKQPLRYAVLLMALLASACSMQIISDFDQVSFNKMMQVSSRIDGFYLRLMYLPKEERTYTQSDSQYIDIEVELNALRRMQQYRPMNELTLKQVDIAIDLWLQDKKAHQEKDTVSDFIIKRHREQFTQVFDAMITGELSKPIN
ncbi:hypothetical protein KIH87_14555 [Paraneptunicella aestuarii]|uniref:hypothetical protein n=1 Tax=Paraneptunicella aestuarii TaxID=2831148 RepID=UPI001E5293FD|nr:hypothetical protein [Paraneptunicella aestuarii]UAA37905.1 hypothetical protein KIH87_14555 [Paraneptunicella aestuarii]